MSMTVERCTSSTARDEYSGPPANSRCLPRWIIAAPTATLLAADLRNFLRFIFLSCSPLFFYPAIFQQVLQFAHEFLHVLEVHINRSEPHVGYLVELLQPLHDHFTDFRRRQFALRGLMHHSLNLVH